MKSSITLAVRNLLSSAINCPLIINLQNSFYFSHLRAWLVTGLLFLLSNFAAIAQQDILFGLTSAGGLQSAGTAFTIQSNGSGFTVQKTFAKSGHSPTGDLIKASDGNFYGMNSSGGTYDYGNIFKISSSGMLTSLHSFNGLLEGGNPRGSLVQGTDGNFYGMTRDGGTNGRGTIFRITPDGTFIVLHSFSLTTEGGNPYGSLIQGADGDFYGLTSRGGLYGNNTPYIGYGTVFKITLEGTLTVLRHLDQANDGSNPRGSLIQGDDGNFYGMTSAGGTYRSGTIFRISPIGTFSVRRHLNPITDGAVANVNNLIKASDGNFYGMLYQGGTYGYGTIFKLTPRGIFTVLKHLNMIPDGGWPNGSLVQNIDGNFYGMTSYGGTYRFGTIFKITLGGTYTVLKNLNALPDGKYARGSLTRNNNDGNFYGMTYAGGNNSLGTIFKITPGGAFTVLVHLPEGSGANPSASLIQAWDGSFYGMTQKGGTSDNSGSIYKFCNSTFSTLKSFDKAADGGNPQGSLVQGADGNFYGVTLEGGMYNYGTIFKITPGGTLTVLWDLDGTIDGGKPWGSLVQGSDGNFYGTAYSGGTYNYGTIFRITASGAYRVLYNLNQFKDGSFPQGSLVQGVDGDFYGMTSSGGIYGQGTIFRITSSGVFQVIQYFDKTNGASPFSNSLIQGTNNNLYGMTEEGGAYGYGTIFKVTPQGSFTLLHSLNITMDGGYPKGSLVKGSANTLYGMAFQGGAYGGGTIFKITNDSNFTVLHHFNLSTDGHSPWGSLVVQKANPIAKAQSVTTAINTPKAITLTATGGGTPLEFKIAGQPQHGTVTGSNAHRVYTPNPGFTGTDSFKFRVIWGCQSSTSKTVIITVGQASMVRINAGGSAVATSLGKFSADTYFSGATSISSTASAIGNTINDALYQDNRRATNNGGNFEYSIPIRNGAYTVKLHFAEIFHITTGKRKFNVSAEGVSWLSNYDIFAAAGGARKALIVTKSIIISDGILNVRFISIVDKACVSAIEVLPVAAGECFITAEELVAESIVATSIYPNPVKTLLTIQLNVPVTNLQSSISDVIGMEMLYNPHQEVNNDKLQINVASLPAGLYLLQLESDQGHQTFKFIKE
ncbi:choice-of-anchor tandem repeat GloVer-containing protein [Adhaeribacter radiodurans]|uniref:T9SS type A sorting domain-containing protein n=1 Tax=Adhaeribacter radiodurans TaxID=2745197 RepID=A0A7L7L7N5_9BACT|nr:choice-of-anchor tandem repeat GloVer-containing protein [Adhaeribacter radiodurans]QMU28764.1 T9SS type A sorting domain-containing protein [Adhaeribacter radiodurans]